MEVHVTSSIHFEGELVQISVPSSWVLANADDILSATNIQVDDYIPDTCAVASFCTTSVCIQRQILLVHCDKYYSNSIIILLKINIIMYR